MHGTCSKQRLKKGIFNMDLVNDIGSFLTFDELGRGSTHVEVRMFIEFDPPCLFGE